LPDLAEGMAEAEVVAWKVKVGDPVVLDQPLVEVMSDKATVEIGSPRAGTLSKINFAEGQVCPVGGVLFVIEEAGGKAASPAVSDHAQAPASPAASPSPMPVPTPTTRVHVPGAAASAEPRPVVVDARADRARVLATPATRRLARTMGVELAAVPTSGRRGRVTSDDVRRFAEAPPATDTALVP